jgi:FMN-dependent oxidoreductase (nitrilotriacetate monooxygenase family)
MTAHLPPADRSARKLILGLTVRTLGAYPGAWRLPDAHSDPYGDADELRSIAVAAESSALDFLYFGDWLTTGPELEATDPSLIARIEPLSAVSFLAGITSRIGLIATINTAHSEPFSTARTTASVDLLSHGRAALNIVTGADPLSARNFGWPKVHDETHRFEAATEYIEILRGLWDSWESDAFVSDKETGRLIDPSKLHSLDYVGVHYSSLGPLNVPRPVQGHLPIVHAGTSVSSRQLASTHADIAIMSLPSLGEAITSYAETKAAVGALGRDPDEFTIIVPFLPLVGTTRDEAWRAYDELADLVEVDDGRLVPRPVELPASRNIRTVSRLLGVPLQARDVDSVVSPVEASRFLDGGVRLLELVRARSGRVVGGVRPVRYRDLIVAHSLALPIVVGSAEEIADELERWFRDGAADGFTILASHRAQFDSFLALVIPELRRRKLIDVRYRGTTLRDHLGLSVPPHSQLHSRAQSWLIGL